MSDPAELLPMTEGDGRYFDYMRLEYEALSAIDPAIKSARWAKLEEFKAALTPEQLDDLNKRIEQHYFVIDGKRVELASIAPVRQPSPDEAAMMAAGKRMKVLAATMFRAHPDSAEFIAAQDELCALAESNAELQERFVERLSFRQYVIYQLAMFFAWCMRPVIWFWKNNLQRWFT